MAEEHVNDERALELIRSLEDRLDSAWIAGELETRVRRASAFGRWSPRFPHGNVLIDTIADFRRELDDRGEIGALQTPSGRALLTYASNVHHVASRLATDEIDALIALLRTFKAPGFLYQCRVAAHYVRDGYALASFSLGGDDAGDVVVDDGVAKVELQCKALEPGAGRRIGNQPFERLAARILNEADHLGWRGRVVVACDVRLADGDVTALAEAVAARMRAEATPSRELSGYSIDVETTTTNLPWDELTLAATGVGCEPLRRPHVAFLGNRHEEGLRVLLIGLSRKRDKVIGKMLATANAASKQLDGHWPGVVCVDTPEAIDWKRVAAAGGLDQHVSRGFCHFGKKPVAALVLTSSNQGGNAFVYRNPEADPPLPEGFRVVGDV